MKPVYQEREGREGEDGGDCFGACVASIMELDLSEVPRVSLTPETEEEWETWLDSRGLWLLTINIEPDGYSIGVEGGHAFVCFDGKGVHDPAASADNDPAAYRPLCYAVLIPRDPAEWRREVA